MTNRNEPINVKKTITTNRNEPINVKKTIPLNKHEPINVKKTIPTNRNEPINVKKTIPTKRKEPINAKKTIPTNRNEPINVKKTNPIRENVLKIENINKPKMQFIKKCFKVGPNNKNIVRKAIGLHNFFYTYCMYIEDVVSCWPVGTVSVGTLLYTYCTKICRPTGYRPIG